MLTVLFTGCGKSKEEKKIEKQIEQENKQELKEAEALMTLWGADEEEIEEELEYIKEEQKETKNERIKAEQESANLSYCWKQRLCSPVSQAGRNILRQGCCPYSGH